MEIYAKQITFSFSIRGTLLAFIPLVLMVTLAYSQEYKGRVVAISDGDTFTLLTPDKQQVKVRLSEIDAPEKTQPFGTRSRQALSELIFSKEVLVVQDDIDRYERLVGQVYVNGINVNRKMVQDGYVWVYRQYLKDPTLLQDEQAAREAKRGLWSLPSTEQVPPWEWRGGERAATAVKESTENNPEFECGTKRYCKEMTSCEEAKYYIKNCGLSRLDGDGIPCEALCQ